MSKLVLVIFQFGCQCCIQRRLTKKISSKVEKGANPQSSDFRPGYLVLLDISLLSLSFLNYLL